MLNAPVPDIIIDNIYGLDSGALAGAGISLLFLDLDNTLVPYDVGRASVTLRNWIDSLKKAGVSPYILSNNHGSRPGFFAKELFLEYTGRAKKPSTEKLLAVLDEKGISPENAAIVGDQVYTDVLCGKRAGILTIAVRPIKFSNPFLLLRYGLEYPFRKARKKRGNKTL